MVLGMKVWLLRRSSSFLDDTCFFRSNKRVADKDSRQGQRYDDAEIRTYVERVHARHDEPLQQAFDAAERAGMPQIQVAPNEGQLLEVLSAMVDAKRVVEVGTLAGYSAVRLARGMKPGGKIFSLEFEEKHAAVAREAIAKANLDVDVEVMVGDARALLPSLEQHGPFDLVFVDADKESYPEYGAWARKNLRPGGILVGDNAYLFGNLTKESERAERMRAFHEEAAGEMVSVCLPTPDGMLVAVKR